MSDAVPVAPSLQPMLDAVRAPREDDAPNRRTLRISALAYLVSLLGMRHSIMTEKLARRGTRISGSQHQGFPVVNAQSDLMGLVTRRDLLDLDIELTALVGDLVKRPAVVIYGDCSAREAADHMVRERVGRLPVVSRDNPRQVIGIVSRSDLLEAHERRLHVHHRVERTIDLSATLAWVRPTEH